MCWRWRQGFGAWDSGWSPSDRHRTPYLTYALLAEKCGQYDEQEKANQESQQSCAKSRGAAGDKGQDQKPNEYPDHSPGGAAFRHTLG